MDSIPQLQSSVLSSGLQTREREDNERESDYANKGFGVVRLVFLTFLLEGL